LLDIVSTFAYYSKVTASELKRKLARAGCTFVDARKHLAIYYQGKCTIMPRHPAKEIKKGTVQSILKSLGIKEL
jgi:mRNA interferase HicA